jgi:peptidoglycan/LPS O-acetylase OafA/YrhL
VPVHQPKAHYVPLDSVRGFAALCVVVHHFVGSETLNTILPHRAWIDVAFFHNAWLCVDLFFVLSGIVISMSYMQSEFGGFDVREFVARRVARIYPLHLAMLLAFLSFRLMKLGLVAIGVLHFAPPEMAVNNYFSFIVNLLLLQASGIIDYLSWNGPSWSISAEFYTYLVFAAVMLLAQAARNIRMVYALSGLLVVGSLGVILFVLGMESLDFHYQFGIVRCILSFFLGVLTIRAVAMVRPGASPLLQSTVQIGAAVTAIVIISLVGWVPSVSFIAPVIFAVLLGSLMVFPRRALPELLTAKPLVWLGKRSYSIYMVHALVLVLIEYFARGVGAARFQSLDGLLPGLPSSVLLVGFVAAVLGLSSLTYATIEVAGSRLVLGLIRPRPAKSLAAAE